MNVTANTNAATVNTAKTSNKTTKIANAIQTSEKNLKTKQINDKQTANERKTVKNTVIDAELVKKAEAEAALREQKTAKAKAEAEARAKDRAELNRRKEQDRIDNEIRQKEQKALRDAEREAARIAKQTPSRDEINQKIKRSESIIQHCNEELLYRKNKIDNNNSRQEKYKNRITELNETIILVEKEDQEILTQKIAARNAEITKLKEDAQELLNKASFMEANTQSFLNTENEKISNHKEKIQQEISKLETSLSRLPDYKQKREEQTEMYLSRKEFHENKIEKLKALLNTIK